MKLVLEITSHSGDGSVSHRSIETFPATLGRGYHNDIIIGDPAVSAQHLRIDYNGTDFIIHELGSENGVTVNDKHHHGASAHLKSGDTVRIGRTDIRVFDPHHPVPPALRVAKTDPVVVWLSRPVNIWLSFTLAILAYMGWTYLEVWDEDVNNTLARAAIGTGITIFMWSLLWGVAGKLVRHKSRFRSHVALASLTVIFFVIAALAEYYVDFLSNENTFSSVFTGGMNLLIFVMLLYYSLTLATDLSQKKKRLWVGFFALGLLISFLGLSSLSNDKFSQAPDYASRLEPYLTSLAAAETPAQFDKGNEEIFSSDVFNAKKKD